MREGGLFDLHIGYEALNQVCPPSSYKFSLVFKFLTFQDFLTEHLRVWWISQDCHKTQMIVCLALHSSVLGNKVRLPILVKTRIDCILDRAGLVLGNLPEGIFPTSPPANKVYHFATVTKPLNFATHHML